MLARPPETPHTSTPIVPVDPNIIMGLLKGINPLLTADLLHILRSMGHGDKLVVCDCNFPAYQVATHTTSKKCVVLTTSLPEALDAICSVLPLDHFIKNPVRAMMPEDGVELPPEGEEVLRESTDAISTHSEDGDESFRAHPLERFAFYEASREAFAVVQTMERRPYGNFILQKGVVGPDGKDLRPTVKG